MQKQNIINIIKQELSYFKTAGDIRENGNYYCEFLNDVDESHCFNDKHHENALVMQREAEGWFYTHNLTPEQKQGFLNFREWHDAEREKEDAGKPNLCEDYYEFEDSYINYDSVNGGHDHLKFYNITFDILERENQFELTFGQDISHYAFFPKHEPLIIATIDKNDTEWEVEKVIDVSLKILRMYNEKKTFITYGGCTLYNEN